ncbi:MAG TPA: Mur ligase domain-containing protein, partial [Patescibacteria group bacterium]
MHIHIVSITGMMTAPLALELKRQGHNVTGSDQEKIYPPFSLLLEKAGIPVNQTPINDDIDLAIIGAAYTVSSITTQAFEDIKKKGIKYVSATEYLASHVVRPESILVAGSFGKTTISCLLSWIFTCLDLNPSYFFGS